MKKTSKTKRKPSTSPNTRSRIPQTPRPAYTPVPGLLARISERSALTRNQIISELTRSPHGALADYMPIARAAAEHDPEFLAHLLTWNHPQGQIRDAKAALPVCSLAHPGYPVEFQESSLALLGMLSPRELYKAWKFSRTALPTGPRRTIVRLIKRYLAEKETLAWQKWDRLALQHHAVLKSLYAETHTRPKNDHIRAVLFGEDIDGNPLPVPPNSIFARVKQLPQMSATEAASTIITERIPFLIAQGALGSKLSSPDVVLALISSMSATELVTNTKMLERLGVKTNPALRAAYEEGLQKRVAKSSANLLKTSRAAEVLEDSGEQVLAAKLRGVQEQQISRHSVEGDWLVLADKSGSMASCIEAARHIAAALTKLVRGKVWLVFFDTLPQTMDVTELALDQIQAKSRYISAQGGTSIGVGLQAMLEAGRVVDGIAIVSDGDENNHPAFAQVYSRYCQQIGKTPPVYFYKFGSGGNLAQTMQHAGHSLETFEAGSVDYYSLPDLARSMRTSRFSLVDEVLASPLVTLDEVFPHTLTKGVLPQNVTARVQNVHS